MIMCLQCFDAVEGHLACKKLECKKLGFTILVLAYPGSPGQKRR